MDVIVVQALQEETRRSAMTSGKSDEAKGRVKEAAGVLTGDKKLQREGKADQVAGKIKKAVNKVKNKAEDAIDDVKDALS
jgi:uncharacterized protein YjbJ (UPF0337 family)